MTIHDYIYDIYSDFKDYVDKSNDLCKLKDMTFKEEHLPDYSDINVQQYYNLRFAFAYAFEYKRMYKKLFVESEYANDSIKVCSLGCGTMIDYWALTEVLRLYVDKDISVDYTGVDVIDWNYKIMAREQDNVNFICGNAADYVDSMDSLDYDVYILPKSISEFAYDDFCSIINSIANKNKKDKIYFLISLRKDSYHMENDKDRCKYIIETLCGNGLITEESPYSHWYFEEQNKGIKRIDHSFDYPDEVKDFLDDLINKCGNKECRINACESTFKRSPILTVSYMYYKLFEFHREASV